MLHNNVAINVTSVSSVNVTTNGNIIDNSNYPNLQLMSQKSLNFDITETFCRLMRLLFLAPYQFRII